MNERERRMSVQDYNGELGMLRQHRDDLRTELRETITQNEELWKRIAILEAALLAIADDGRDCVWQDDWYLLRAGCRDAVTQSRGGNPTAYRQAKTAELNLRKAAKAAFEAAQRGNQ